MSKTQLLLQDWYIENHRDLPFRKNRDPYRVWISEIMAQQTQIDTLIPYYNNWLLKFDSIQAIAQAKEEDILKAWEGLGYYSRARNLRKAAKMIMDDFNGTFPSTESEILSLKGIGPYTAAAIASICFDEKCAAIDGNVKRVISRLYMKDNEVKTFVPFVKEKIEIWMNDVKPHILTQAIMELGALVCTKQAKCEICPVKENCLAYQNDCIEAYPISKKQLIKKIEHKSVILYKNKKNQFALTNTHLDTLMKGYYRLPEAQQLNIDISKLKKDRSLSHVFSHKRWDVDFYIIEEDIKNAELLWVSQSDLSHYPIITLHRKYLNSKTL